MKEGNSASKKIFLTGDDGFGKIGLVKPDDIDGAGLIFEDGLLEIFSLSGVDILEFDDGATKGDVLVGTNRGGGFYLGEVEVTSGKMIKQIMWVED